MSTWLITTEVRNPDAGDIVIPPDGVLTVVATPDHWRNVECVGIEPAQPVVDLDLRLLALLQNASSVIVTRASEQARQLAQRPSCTTASLGKDTVNIKLELDPEDADMLLRFIGGRS